MDTRKIWVEVIGHNRKNFENTYKYVTEFQDQVDKKVATLFEETPLVPEPVKEFYRQWLDTAKNSREAFRKFTAEGYQGIENYLVTAA